jgi:putative FmdB family regulatory protein
MPIYEYQCLDCGKKLEALQKISDPLLVDCPSCGAASLKKMVSAAAFRLKGGGWYETDFKTGNKKNLAGGADSSAGSATPSAPAAASDKPSSTPAASDKPSSAGAK